ncbi:hypothetical protein BDB00DRAFT_756586, partial [Zychaea mexicana]|uniref:uncharacterized protein n=1 Tax=Zychaea mexicana TaxID=64656 RepID=UPI0022FEA028
MEAWEVLCSKAFNGDEAANHLILFLEGCGKLTATGFTVTTSSLNNPDCALLEQLGFVAAQPQNNNNEYTLPGQQWSSFLEKKRNARVAWHEQRQRELRLELNDALKQIQVLDGVNDQQRLALVKEFARRF